MHEIYIINQQTFNLTTNEVYSSSYYSCYIDKELAIKACIILKHEDEISGMYFSRYIIYNDTIQTELPEQDPGMRMSEEEIQEKVEQMK